MPWIKKFYLYVVSLVSLIIIVVAAIMLVNMGLKQWVFTQADRNFYYPVCTPAAAPDQKGIACDSETQKQQQENDAKARTSQKQRDAAQAISMIIVASPIFWYHWKLARRET